MINKNNLSFFKDELEKNSWLFSAALGSMGIIDAKRQADLVKSRNFLKPRPLGHFTQYRMQGGRFPIGRFR